MAQCIRKLERYEDKGCYKKGILYEKCAYVRANTFIGETPTGKPL